MTIIDKRKAGKNKSVENRQRFIKRYKQHIKKSIEENDGSVSDAANNRRAKISKKDLKEPDFNLDSDTGRHKRVLPGNKQFESGDRISKGSKSGKRAGKEGGGDSGEEEDSFSFVLTKDEFIDIYFSELALPDFIKQSLKDTKKMKWLRSGYSKEGIPPRLDILKTFKQAIARRIATESSRFLDEIDLRYKHFVKKPVPILHAHVFFLMDVSGSMGEYEKMLAKKFFTLLYMFLNKEYEKIEVSFIRHTTDAQEVTEYEFFYSRESGGTIVSTGLRLVNEIINDRINLSETNVYVAQASDGDNYYNDETACMEELQKLLEKVQYFAYIQTEEEERAEYKAEHDLDDLFDLYGLAAQENRKLNIKRIFSPEDIYPVFKELFSKKD